MRLERYELDSALWVKLKEHINGRLEILRSKNDGDLDPIQTARLRGEIKAFKSILALADQPSPVMVADSE